MLRLPMKKEKNSVQSESFRARRLGGQMKCLLPIAAFILLAGCATLNEEGYGFIFLSSDFGDPCTQNPGDIPRVYDNGSTNPVDVSVQVFNTANVNLFIDGTGFVIPPTGPQDRPRAMRRTLQPGESFGIKAQGADCGWIAIVHPH
jgi:hypothetical protein